MVCVQTTRSVLAASLTAALLALAQGSSAQNQITPGQPTQPFVGQAALNNPQTTFSYGIEFVTVNVRNNPAWQGGPNTNDLAIGRGSVAEPFRIGRYEVTTAQWAAFFNAYSYVSATQGSIPFVQLPSRWGAGGGVNPYGGGQGFSVAPGREMIPVGGISWRTAAIYCNWLCNNQALTRDAFMSGAYNVSTFGYAGPRGDIFTDQFAHTPGAAYFLPTWDQWLVAAHYDPNRNGPGQGGYWGWANCREAQTPGGPPPGFDTFVGEANWGNFANQFDIPLGAYADVQSPWGLFDTAGGTSEWTGSVRIISSLTRYRYIEGSGWTMSNESDRLGGVGADFPSFPLLDYGFRIAATVPSPTSATLLTLATITTTRRRQR